MAVVAAINWSLCSYSTYMRFAVLVSDVLKGIAWFCPYSDANIEYMAIPNISTNLTVIHIIPHTT